MSAPPTVRPEALHLPVNDADATPRAQLDDADRAEMFALLGRHFDGVTEAQFAADLDEKDWVLRLRRDGELVGFTTLQLTSAHAEGRTIRIVYSGDTIMDPSAWGSPALARAWIALVRALRQAHPAERWFWLLLSSGFRTYRFLPVFWRDFWPRTDAATPPATQALLDTLARRRFGTCYDAAAGVVRFEHPQRLRPMLAIVPDSKTCDPHIAYFVARNPGHAAGDELVCLTELCDDNLTPAGRRMVGLPRT